MDQDSSPSKTVLFYDVSGRGGGSSASLRIILAGLDRRRYSPVLVFGDRGNKAAWGNERVIERTIGRFDNHDFFPASLSVRWLYTLIRFLVLFPVGFFTSSAVLHRVNPDVVHINTGSGLLFGMAAAHRRIPVVWHMREMIARNFFGRLQDMLYAHCSTRVIVVSRAAAERIPHCASKTEVIPDPVGELSADADAVLRYREDYGLQSAEFVILLLATPSAQKGYLFLADVAEDLNDLPDLKFVLAGDINEIPATLPHRILRTLYRSLARTSGEREAIKSRWRAMVDSGRAIFPGRVPAGVAVAASTVVVCPNTVSESFGRTIIEAYSLGKPVLASRIPPFDETVKEGETGYLLPLDRAEWSRAIRSLYNDRSRIEELGKSGRMESEKYGSADHVARVMGIYDKALS